MLPNFEQMSDTEIRQRLNSFGEDLGPINSSTRTLYIKKLKRLYEENKNPSIKKNPDKFNPLNISHKEEEEEDEDEPLNSSANVTASPAQRRGRRKNADLNTSSVSASPRKTPGSSTKRRPTRQSGGAVPAAAGESLDMEVEQLPVQQSPTVQQFVSVSSPRKRSRGFDSQNGDGGSTGGQHWEQQSVTLREEDSSQDFGNMIAKKLRHYELSLQNIIQNEIMSVFIRADSGYYSHH